MKGKKERVLSEVNVVSNESQYLQFFRPLAWNYTLVVQTRSLLFWVVEGTSASLKRVSIFLFCVIVILSGKLQVDAQPGGVKNTL